MNNTGADIAISTLGKLTDQELAAMRAASRDGNRPLYEISSTRYHAYLTAKPVKIISLNAYRLFERWRLSQSEADE